MVRSIFCHRPFCGTLFFFCLLERWCSSISLHAGVPSVSLPGMLTLRFASCPCTHILFPCTPLFLVGVFFCEPPATIRTQHSYEQASSSFLLFHDGTLYFSGGFSLAGREGREGGKPMVAFIFAFRVTSHSYYTHSHSHTQSQPSGHIGTLPRECIRVIEIYSF